MKKKGSRLGLAAGRRTPVYGCGTDKNLEPDSELLLARGGSARAERRGESAPDTSHLLPLPDQAERPSLSLVPSDAWTVDSYDIRYTLVERPGAPPRCALPAVADSAREGDSRDMRPSLPVTIVSDSYLRDNAPGFHRHDRHGHREGPRGLPPHRNKDGYAHPIPARFLFNIGNF